MHPPENEPGHNPEFTEPIGILPTLRSEDGRVVLTTTALQIDGRLFSLLELEATEVKPVRWLLWYLLGGFTLALFMLGFLQNWLRTMPAAMGMAVGALLLAIARRGAKRLRIMRLGQEDVFYTLSGDLGNWLVLFREVNRRIQARHDAQAALLMASFAPPEAAPDTLPAGPTEPD